MAREEKRMVLRTVDETAEQQIPVVRLENDDTIRQLKPVRLEAPEAQLQESLRLDMPAPEVEEFRTHQPGIEALMDIEAAAPDVMENNWGESSVISRDFPWGWFVLLGIMLAGAALWSLSRVEKADVKLEHLRADTETSIKKDAQDERDATRDIDSIDLTIRQFFASTSVDAMARLVRQPERVRPLMVEYYAKRELFPNRLLRIKQLQPLTLDNRANFWVASLELSNHQACNLIVEILDSGETRVDWETFVCYQPMSWDAFARERPEGNSLDFRVYVEQDSLFSHEFKDDKLWNCFHLIALDSDEPLFGYAQADSMVSQQILELLKKNEGQKTSVILRVIIPAGLQSKRGVMIEKLMSPRWLYIGPPDSSS